ncbi:MAG TPA: transposase [Roseiflexaceae bacterium]|nr:transposase [Roseiflexaceae bacterium]
MAIVDLTREKNIRGRKRHLLVDTNGFVLRVLVSAADISDTEGGTWLLLNAPDAFPSLTTLRTDQGYRQQFIQCARQLFGCAVEVIRKPKGQRGFVVQAKRWVVERTFAWLGRNRQLSKEYDCRPESTEAWIYLASIGLLLNRLHPSS